MTNTPSKAEIEALVKRHGATSYRNRADTQHPAYGFTEDGLNGLIDEVLAKWDTPQPAPAPLSDGAVKDAARWRMAVLIGNELMLRPDKRTHATAVKAYMDATHSGLGLTGAVDAALAAQGGK